MEDDFQMLKCLFWQLLQKTETCLARTTRRDVKHWYKWDQAHGRQSKQNPESIDTGKIGEPREQNSEPQFIACHESMFASVVGCTHTFITALHATHPFLYLHYLSCKDWCQYVNQGNSSQVICLLDIMGLVKHAWLESNRFVFQSWVHYLPPGWPWLNCLTPNSPIFLSVEGKL